MIQKTSLAPSAQNSVLETAVSRQLVASNPLNNVWVSASAGTGKTKVLTDRVLRLLLPSQDRAATPPEKILCITFTKAAAAEMASRIHEVLAEWTELPDDKLKASLQILLNEEVPDETMKEARRLFARIVDTSGGMKILTLHSFCQSILKRFPIEAGLNPAFEVIDDRNAKEILQSVVDKVFYVTHQMEDSIFKEPIEYLARILNEEQFNTIVKTLVNERQQFHRLFKKEGDISLIISKIYQSQGLDENETRQDILKEFSDMLDWITIRDIIVTLDGGTEAEKRKSLELQPLVENKNDGELHYSILEKFLLTQKGEPQKNPISAGTLKKVSPHLQSALGEMQNDIILIKDKLTALRLAEASKALVTIANGIIHGYQIAKRQSGFLDYDDLIDETVSLLSEAGQSAWVLFKLDGGIDHILVDEAQDTSPEQWRVIEALTSEFFSGEGREVETQRTLFVVGDEKQSIYSFQKADPYEFVRMRQNFHEKINAANQYFEAVSLQVSFRSTSSVLSFVDKVFANQIVAKGVSLEEDNSIQHLVFRDGQAGHVEIWPLAISTDKQEKGIWDLPLEPKDQQDGDTILGEKIAKTIHGWIKNKEILVSQNRAVEPSDIMILLRKRGKLMEDLVSALKAYDVPVAGVDRLKLKDQLCVQDLLSAASFVLLPHDNLNLACLLKSPLLGCNDDDLMAIGAGRGKISLWDTLRKNKTYAHIYEHLKHLLLKQSNKRPFEFFSTLLSMEVPYAHLNGKKAMISRLGHEAIDPMDEFLNLTLNYEQNHISTLQSFLAWVEQDDFDIKRELNKNQNMVSIMTVHGSKGLQAPIVFMADSARYLDAKMQSKSLIWDGLLPLWAPRAEFKHSGFKLIEDSIKAKEDDEYRRLFYVGLTRAQDRLYICGSAKKDKIPEQSWYHYSKNTILELNGSVQKPWDEENLDNWNDDKLYCYSQNQTAAVKQSKKELEENKRYALPNWINQNVEAEETISRPLKPSKPDEDLLPLHSPLDEVGKDEIRFARGILIHSLLEFLPSLSPDKREQACFSYIEKQKPTWSKERVQQITTEVLGVLHHPEFADVFGVGSKAEVAISGLIESKTKGKSFVLSGKIDRLVIREKDILIVDYKTNRPAANSIADIPAAYLKQMAAYRDVIQKIYPNREVKTALLWTDITKLMILPSGLLDEHRP